MKRSHGFTLIELMVAIAIIGILLVIAVPQYTEYVQRGQLVEATSTLNDLRSRMEQRYQDNRGYSIPAVVPVPATGWLNTCGVAAPDPSSIRYFTFTCALTLVDQGYLLTASGKSGTRVAGIVYTVNEANQRRTMASASFMPVSPASCWISRKGTTC